MGRKPNQLILEFFNRGPKLEDSSNRYQHTCKSCGEKFPKGRIDSLTNHLIKKCQAIGLRDRQRVLMRMHEMPDLTGAGTAADSNNPNAPAGKKADGSFGTRPNFDGLNVLAEASRQVGASDHTKPRPAFTQSVTSGGKTVVVDPALETEFTVQSDVKAEDDSVHIDNGQATGITIPALPSHVPEHPTSLSPPLGDHSMTPDSTSNARQSQLSMIAASANEMVPQGFTLDDEGLKVGQWNQHDQLVYDSLQRHDPTLTAAAQDAAAQDTATQDAAAYPRPIAMNTANQAKGFVNDFGDSTKPAKPKVRGRFSAERRLEVQEVRKRGACIRCRVLRKPCSSKTPCDTCASVESARLWKHPCIRTRLADEFQLYNTNLHATLAYHDTNAIQNQIKFEPYVGRIEVTHSEDSMVFIAIAGLQGHRTSVSALDPQLQSLGEDQFSAPAQEIYLLDTESDDIPSKIEAYIKKTGQFLVEREASPFMKFTLQLAHELSQTKKDSLLERVVDLWVATHILVDNDLTWKTYCNPTLPSTSMHPLSQASDEGRLPIEEVNDPESYALLCSQLRAATEKRAMQLSKSVLVDLERRLLQRQKKGWFELFLAAIIVLNCVERITWLFRSWDNETFAPRWPFERRPPHYYLQSERFTGILHMLLRMRVVPPKTDMHPDTAVLKAAEGSDENAVRWFDMIQVTPYYLSERTHAVFDPQDSRSLDLQHIAGLLLPQT
ncbi:Fungal Zn(2)-Cys(6) binuclear cluster domain-containing protein [Penicillium ucsense]|uniref:Fungal Zn(2)-Cys(6) binuclear cluster domain-containing protein n=1 Tax=Penicillium ucsense TaxID=2839758 RepID=A0A8J8W958_9EURO|nr:Fungal Zn(2)-Cys(6) binuclear cluster domain-containing protein [Penicillium ucsense]KAF7736828.1 Fungal Zn(2)-Cys(6) binuclear cluster domain-containing protein [Penicillium ucsense]